MCGNGGDNTEVRGTKGSVNGRPKVSACSPSNANFQFLKIPYLLFLC